jgi:lysyl-tRNA synthetase, class II
MLEWYEAYADYESTAARLETLVGEVANAVGYEGEIDFRAPWRRITFVGAIEEATGLDVAAVRDRDELEAAIRERGLDMPTEGLTWPQLVDDLLAKYVEPALQ